MEIDTIVIDNIRYVIIKEMVINNQKYVYLSNIDDPSDFFIKKIKVINDKEILTGIDSDEEFELVLLTFTKELNK